MEFDLDKYQPIPVRYELRYVMLKKLRDRAEREGIENITPILGSLHDPRLPAATVDLVLLVSSGLLEPERARRALGATFGARGTHPLPASLPEPPPDWEEPYAALAQGLGLPALTLGEAHAYLDAYWRQWELGRVNESGL